MKAFINLVAIVFLITIVLIATNIVFDPLLMSLFIVEIFGCTLVLFTNNALK